MSISTIDKNNSTIFKTYSSDLDGISNKLGFSKRSSSEWGRQVSQSFNEAEGKLNKFTSALKTAFVVPSSDEWVRNDLGDIITKDNIDSYMPQLDDDKWFESTLNTLVEVDKKVKASEVTWQDYFSNFKEGEKWQIEFVQNTDLQKASLDDVKKSYNSVRDAAVAHNAALKQQTLGAKAGQLALKGLTLVGNMFASWAISSAISKVVEGIQYLASANERYLDSQQEIIDKTNEQIAEYDEEIDSLNSLLEKLTEAKGNKEKLAEIQNDLNDAIGKTPGILNGEETAWNVANQKIVDRIALLKKLREEELSKNIQATKNIYNNQEVDNAWGSDKKLTDYFDYTEGQIFYEKAHGKALKSFNDLVNEYYQQESPKESFAEFIADYMQDNMEEGILNHLPNAEEIQSYLDSQYSTIVSLFSEYVSNLETVLPQEALNNVLKELIYTNPNDAEAVEEQFKAFINTLENSDLEEIYNDYLISLTDDSLNSEKLYENLQNIINDLAKEFPTAQQTLNSFFDTISTKGANNAEEAIEMYNKAKENNDKSDISFLDTLNSSDFADTKEKLLDLAKSGEITSDVLESTEDYKTLLDKTGVSVEEAKLKILSMLTATEKLSAASKGMDSLSTAFEEWQDKGFVTASALDALPDVFKELDGYDLFSQIVGNPDSSKQEISQAFDDIATEYLKSQGTLEKITVKNTSAYIANLKEMGIANAEEVVNEYSQSKNSFKVLLNEASNEWAVHLQSNNEALQIYLSETDTKNAELMNAFGEEYSTDYQNWLELLQKKKDAYDAYIEALNGTLVQTPDELKNKYSAKTDQIVNKNLANILYAEYEAANKEIEEYAAQYSAKLASTKFTSGSIDFTGSNSSSSSDTDTPQTYDWIETKLTNLTTLLDTLKSKSSDTYSTWSDRSSALSQAISKTTEAIDLQAQAYDRYIQEANSVGLSDTYKTLVQNGAIDINSISDETLKDKISEYQTWYEKAQDCLQTQQDLKDNLNDLNSQKFTNLKAEYDALLESMENQKELLESQITLLSTASDYNNLRSKQASILIQLQNERTALSSLLNSSSIQKYTEEWYSLTSQIEDFDQQIVTASEALKEIDTLQFDNLKSSFDFDISRFEHMLNTLQDETDLLELKGLFANESYYDGMKTVTQKQLDTLTSERAQLAAIFENTSYEKGTAEWNDMFSTLMDIDGEITSLTKDMTEYDNTIRDLNWEIFEYMEDSINRITDETEYLIELLSKEDLFDNENGSITENGIAAIGLHAAAYEVYKQQAQDYYEEAESLQKQLIAGAGKDVLEQYNNMVDAHQEAVLAAEDEKQAILDLIEQGYNTQLEALQKLIDKKKEQLNAEKSLYDYQKSIEEKTKNIASLEKRQIVYEGDTSEEAMSKIQQIKVELEEARADLKETEYEQYLSDTETMLDNLSSDYEEWMNARLDDEDALLTDILSAVDTQSSNIMDTLNSVASQYGTMISDNIYNIFGSESATAFASTLTNSMNDLGSVMYSSVNAVNSLIAANSEITNGYISSVGEGINGNLGTANAGIGNLNSSLGATNQHLTDIYNSAGGLNNTVNDLGNSITSAVSGTQNAISALLNQILSAIGSNTNAGSNSSASTNTSSTTASTGTGNTSAKTGSSSSTGIFIQKTDSYPKSKLNIDTSVVDRLKYNNFDSSFSARATYYSKLGGTGTYTGSDSQNTWLLKKMKSMGYKSGTIRSDKEWAWTQEDGGELIRTKDGALLTPLDNSMVFDNEASKRLWEFSQNPDLFMQQLGLDNLRPQINIDTPDVSRLMNNNAAQEVSITVDGFNMSLPNVTNYKEFRNELIKDSSFTNAMGICINNKIMGKNSLEHLKYSR